jgi:hypothetical protein
LANSTTWSMRYTARAGVRRWKKMALKRPVSRNAADDSRN